MHGTGKGGITLTSFECIPKGGSVNRTPLPAAPGVGLLSLRSSVSLGLLTNEHPGPLCGLAIFPSGRPEASFLPPEIKNPSHLSVAGVLAGCGGGGIRTHDTRKGMPVFKTGAFNQAPPPLRWLHQGSGRQIYAEQSSLSKEDVFKRLVLRL